MKFEKSIVADGVTQLLALPIGKSQMTILTRGTFGSGTLTFGYMDTTDTFVPFVSKVSAITAPDEVTFDLGSAVTAAVELTGSTNPSIVLSVSG